MFLVLLLARPGFSQEEESEFENSKQFYPTINLLVANPVQEFWANYSKQRLWGFNFDLVYSAVKSAMFWQPGFQLEYYPIGTQKATWHGLEVETSGAFTKINLISRFRFLNFSKLSPYIELGYGLHLSSTTTTYEIVDEATFFEEVVFDKEDYTETVKAKEFYDATHNFSVGAGICFNRLITFQIKYNVTPLFKFVEKDDVTVTQTSIDYKITESKMLMFVVSVGFSLEKMFF